MAQKNIIQFFGGNRSTKRPILDDFSETLNPCKKQKIGLTKKSKGNSEASGKMNMSG